MRPETYSELEKACLNIAVGLFLVGILQPILTRKAIVRMEKLSGPMFLILVLGGAILLNKGVSKNDNQP